MYELQSPMWWKYNPIIRRDAEKGRGPLGGAKMSATDALLALTANTDEVYYPMLRRERGMGRESAAGFLGKKSGARKGTKIGRAT